MLIVILFMMLEIQPIFWNSTLAYDLLILSMVIFLKITVPEFKEICIQIINSFPSFDICPFWCTFKFSHIIYCYFCDCNLGLKCLLNTLVLINSYRCLNIYVLQLPPPSDSYVWILTSDMMVPGAGPLLGWQGHDGGALRNGISALVSKTPHRAPAPPALWRHSKKSASATLRPSTRTEQQWHLVWTSGLQNWKISAVYKLPTIPC